METGVCSDPPLHGEENDEVGVLCPEVVSFCTVDDDPDPLTSCFSVNLPPEPSPLVCLSPAFKAWIIVSLLTPLFSNAASSSACSSVTTAILVLTSNTTRFASIG